MALGEAVVDVTANTTRFAAQAQAGVRGALKGASAQLKATGSAFRQTGRTMSRSLTLPLVGAGAAIIKTAGDFEFSMNKLSAITGATGKDLEAMEDQAKQLGKTTQFSAGQSADAMTFLGMAGFETKEILDAMPGTLDLAAAGNMELAQTADIVSNVLTGFGKEASESTNLADIMAKTITTTNTNMAQLGDAMKFVAPVAASAGVSIEETSAAIGLLGNAGIQGSMAGTTLRGAIARLLDPAPKAQKALDRLGVSVKDSSGEMLPMADIIEQLGDSGAKTADLMQIFGLRAGPGMAALLDQGADAMREQTAALGEAGGTAGEIAGKQMEGLRGAMLRLKAAGEAVAIAIGESGLLQSFTGIAERVGEFLSKLSETNPAMLRAGVIVAALVAAIGPLLVVLGLVISGAGTVVGAIAAISLPVVAVIAAIGLLVAGFIHLWRTNERFREIVMQVWEQVKQFVTTTIRVVSQVVRTVIDNILMWWSQHGEELIATVMGFWDQVQDIFSAAVDAVTGFVKFAVNAIQRFWDGFAGPFIGSVKRMWDNITRMVAQVWNGIKQIISGVLDVIKGIFNVFAGIFTGDWNRVWEGIKSIFSGIWRAIIGILKAVWATIQGVVRNALEVLRTIMNAAFNAIRVLVSGAWNAVVTMFKTAWRNLKDAVRSGIADTMGEIETIKDAITGFFSGAKDWLIDAGKRILQGLADGITGAISAPVDAIKGAVDKVRSFLPFSPAKVGPLSGRGSPDRAGRMIGEMLAGGIEDSRRSLERAMVGALAPAGDMRAIALDRAGTPDRVDRSVRNDVNVEVHVASGDPQEIGRATALAVRAELPA